MIVRSKVTGDEILLNRLKTKKNVIFHNGYEVEEIYGGEIVEGIALKKLGSGTISKIFKSDIEKVPVEGVFLGIGLNPNTAMFEGLVEMNKEKEIIVNENCETNVEGVFAAGDATSIKAKQIASSVGEGVKALLSAYAYLKK